MARKKVDFNVFDTSPNQEQVDKLPLVDSELEQTHKTTGGTAGMVQAIDEHRGSMEQKIIDVESDNVKLKVELQKIQEEKEVGDRNLELVIKEKQVLEEDLKKEKEALEKFAKDNGIFLTDIDPRECQVIQLQGRIQQLLNEKVCKDLIDDFRLPDIGQKEAIYLRPIPDNVEKLHDGIKYEVFAGTRRRFAAEYVVNNYNPEFRLEGWVKNVSDIDASLYTEKENAKKDWHEVETGFFYWDMINNNKFYKNIVELAKKRNVPEPTVRDYYKFGVLREDVPDVVEAFRTHLHLLDLKILWAKKILSFLKKEDQKQAIISQAKNIISSEKKYTPKKIFDELVDAAEIVIEKPKRLEVIQEHIKHNKNAIGKFSRSAVNNYNITLKSPKLSKEEIKRHLCEYIDKYYVKS